VLSRYGIRKESIHQPRLGMVMAKKTDAMPRLLGEIPE
jgi:hypothetical protein